MNRKNLVLIIAVILTIALACSEEDGGGNNVLFEAVAVGTKKVENDEKFNKAINGMREALEKADSVEEFTKENESLHKELIALSEEGERLGTELVRLYEKALEGEIKSDAMRRFLQASSEYWKKSLEEDKLTTAHLKSTWGRWDKADEEKKAYEEKKAALEKEKEQLEERFLKIAEENPDVFGDVKLDE